MFHSICGLPAIYTLSQEFLTRFHSEWVVRLNGKFLLSHENDAVAKEMARIHSSMKGA